MKYRIVELAGGDFVVERYYPFPVFAWSAEKRVSTAAEAEKDIYSKLHEMRGSRRVGVVKVISE